MKKIILSSACLLLALTMTGCANSSSSQSVKNLNSQLSNVENVVTTTDTNNMTSEVGSSSDYYNEEPENKLNQLRNRVYSSILEEKYLKDQIMTLSGILKSSQNTKYKLAKSDSNSINSLSNDLKKYTACLEESKSEVKSYVSKIKKQARSNNVNNQEVASLYQSLDNVMNERKAYLSNLLNTMNEIATILENNNVIDMNTNYDSLNNFYSDYYNDNGQSNDNTSDIADMYNNSNQRDYDYRPNRHYQDNYNNGKTINDYQYNNQNNTNKNMNNKNNTTNNYVNNSENTNNDTNNNKTQKGLVKNIDTYKTNSGNASDNANLANNENNGNNNMIANNRMRYPGNAYNRPYNNRPYNNPYYNNYYPNYGYNRGFNPGRNTDTYYPLNKNIDTYRINPNGYNNEYNYYGYNNYNTYASSNIDSQDLDNTEKDMDSKNVETINQEKIKHIVRKTKQGDVVKSKKDSKNSTNIDTKNDNRISDKAKNANNIIKYLASQSNDKNARIEDEKVKLPVEENKIEKIKVKESDINKSDDKNDNDKINSNVINLEANERAESQAKEFKNDTLQKDLREQNKDLNTQSLAVSTCNPNKEIGKIKEVKFS